MPTTKSPLAIFQKLRKQETNGAKIADVLFARAGGGADHRKEAGALTHGLAEERRLEARAEGRMATSDDLFEAFIQSSFEYPGDHNIGMADTGVGVGVEIGVNFGDLILPGFVNADVAVTPRGSRTSSLLLLLIKQGHPHAGSVAEAGAESLGDLCFIKAKGQIYDLSLTLDAGIGVDASAGITGSGRTENMTQSHEQRREEKRAERQSAQASEGMAAGSSEYYGLELLAVDAAAKADASVTGSVSGSYMLAYDFNPVWFESARHDDLRAEFATYCGRGTKKGTKSRIKEFFSETSALGRYLKSQNVLERFTKYMTGGSRDFKTLEAALQNALQLLTSLVMYGRVQRFVDDARSLEASIDTELAKGGMLGSFGRRGSDTKAALKADLRAFFGRSERQVLGLDPDKASLEKWKGLLHTINLVFAMSDAQRDRLFREISIHLSAIQNFRDDPLREDARSLLVLRRRRFDAGLTFLSMWGCGGAVGAGVSAEVGAKVSVLAASAEATATVRVESKRTRYRLQHYTRAPGYVMFTQDTILYYSQTRWDTATEVKYTGKQKEGGSDKPAVNQFSYESAQAVWSWTPTVSNTCPLLLGSGISIGLSVSVEMFRTLCGHETGALAACAKALKLSEDQLMDAIEDFGSSLWDADFPVDALILEATFAVELAAVPLTWAEPSPGQMAARAERDVLEDETNDAEYENLTPTIDKNVLEHMKRAEAKWRLQAIRLRYRLADAKDSSTTFKLGTGRLVKVGIELSSIERAGASAVVDLAVHWQDADLPTAATIVAPPVIIHQ
jgi:hypothetical protein